MVRYGLDRKRRAPNPAPMTTPGAVYLAPAPSLAQCGQTANPTPKPAPAPIAVQINPFRTRRLGSGTRTRRTSARDTDRSVEPSRTTIASGVAETKEALVRAPLLVVISTAPLTGSLCTAPHSVAQQTNPTRKIGTSFRVGTVSQNLARLRRAGTHARGEPS
jgi:hypothetical protein